MWKPEELTKAQIQERKENIIRYLNQVDDLEVKKKDFASSSNETIKDLKKKIARARREVNTGVSEPDDE